MLRNNNSNYRWYILALSAITSTFAVAMPWMSMTVLFKEISEDLGLSLVQIGTVWGILPLSGILVVQIGGMLGDRFGAKNVLGVTCLLAGLVGAGRGLPGSFISLATIMFLFGLPIAIIPLIVTKNVGTWFQGPRLALAQGIVTMSMALGFTLGTLLSATVFSPLLGSWRNVMFIYGAISVAISIPWFLTRDMPSDVALSAADVKTIPFRQAISHVFRIKGVWLLLIIMLGHIACVQGMLGYLPLYLREIGWTATRADSTAASFHVASLIATIPIALLSNKLGSRKVVILAAMLMTTIGVTLLSVVSGPMIWPSVLIAGVVRDGFMAVFFTALIETKGVGAIYAGTALGLIFTFVRLGEFASPPIGNSLANINSGLPFLFWGSLAAVALVASYFLKGPEKKQR